MRKVMLAGAALALLFSAPALDAQKVTTEEQAQSLVKGMKPQQGRIALSEAKASLDLGSDYDFYGPADARTILVDLWGNPPDSADGVLGLVMPAGKSPLDGSSWGAVITYDPSGYVSDSDAANVDYGDLLKQLQDGEVENNKQREANGYPAMHLLRWAEQPNYDKTSHSVVWAQDFQVTGNTDDSLNYDVRTLGRGGVLSVNLLSTMSNLPQIKAAAHEFASHVKFDNGARYEDFDSSMDKKAEYGIGGLVAAGVGVAVAKKLGFLALLLKFIKPILIAVAAAGAAFKNRILGLFGRKTDPLEGGD